MQHMRQTTPSTLRTILRTRAALVTLLTLAMASAGCIASDTAEVGSPPTPASSELLQAEVPDGWIQVVDKVVGTLAISEYVPADTIDVWQQKLSYEALGKDSSPGTSLPDPLDYSQGIAAQQESRCEQFTDNAVFAGFENGYQTSVHIMQCGMSKLTGKPLLTMLKVIRGNDSLYSITRIWRLDMADDATVTDPKAAGPNDNWNPSIDALPETLQQELAAWSQVLRRIQLCDRNLQAHRCAPPKTPQASTP